MAAHITMGADRTADVTQHDHAVGEQIQRDEVSGRWNLTEMADDLPARLEDALVFEPRQLRVIVNPTRQASRQRASRLDSSGGGASHGCSGRIIYSYNSTLKDYIVIY